ncbi:hypothetical protein [Peribacillus sp. SCS-155]|uniref:hypothetical protein n=1 Tax=Peribacillus sedimenti TaxID=3115297 RepID=UPI0039064336
MMKEIQEFLRKYQKDMNWHITDQNYEETKTSLLHNYLLLTTEIGEIAEEFRSVFNATIKNSEAEDIQHAFEIAKEAHRENIGKEIADCIAYLVKFANYFNIDMDKSFYSKMEEVKNRVNKDA